MKMIDRLRAGGVVCAFLGLFAFGGCASANRVALAGAEKQIGSTQGVVVVRKQEIGAEIRGSNSTAVSGQFGLIGSLVGSAIDASIENSQAKKAESTVVPIRDALVGYDVGKVFVDSLRAELDNEQCLKNIQIETRRTADSKTLNSLVEKTNKDAVLVVDIDYHMTPSFDGLSIRARVSLHAHTAGLAAKAKAKDDLPAVLFFNELSTAFYVPATWGGSEPTPSSYVGHWAENGGKNARLALDSGLSELAKMIRFDLGQPGVGDARWYTGPDRVETRTAALPWGTGHEAAFVQGYVVHTEAGRVWIRMPSGQLVSTAL